MLQANSVFEYCGGIYRVDCVTSASATVSPILIKKHSLGTCNISVNADVKVLLDEEAKKYLSESTDDALLFDGIDGEIAMTTPKKRGRKKGSKNKSRNEDINMGRVKELMSQTKRGRKKGSTNKPKISESPIASDTISANPTETTTAKKRGRPKGSKNKV
jgi:hypothetical protein